MTTYEIREDRTSYYYPFTVYENGNPTDRHFGSQRGAQLWINTNQAGSEVDLYLFSNQKAAGEVQETREASIEKKVVFFDGPYEVGTIITDEHNRKYRTTRESYHLSAREVADLEDGWDVSEHVGWHTPAELVEENENNA